MTTIIQRNKLNQPIVDIRLTAAGARRLTADPAAGAEVLLWEME